jgi:hypothetical protein
MLLNLQRVNYNNMMCLNKQQENICLATAQNLTSNIKIWSVIIAILITMTNKGAMHIIADIIKHMMHYHRTHLVNGSYGPNDKIIYYYINVI